MQEKTHVSDPLGCAAAGVPWDMTDPHYDYIWPDGRNPLVKTSDLGLDRPGEGCLGWFDKADWLLDVDPSNLGVVVPASLIRTAILAYGAAHGMTWYRIAHVSGVATSTIDTILRGHNRTTLRWTVERLAAGLGLTVPEFLAYAEQV